MELEKSTKPFDETTISDVKNLTSKLDEKNGRKIWISDY